MHEGWFGRVYMLYVVPCGMSMLNQWNVPQGYVVFYGGLKALLDLLGPYCVYRIIYMSCLMSCWDVNPTIRYILYAFAHIVVAMCVLFSRWSFSCPARQDCMALICYLIFIPSDSWTYTENQPCQMTDSVD